MEGGIHRGLLRHFEAVALHLESNPSLLFGVTISGFGSRDGELNQSS
jgi:hypothetical protein